MSARDIEIRGTLLPYDDAEASLRFYREALGLAVREDADHGSGRRIALVAPGGSGFSIVLEPAPAALEADAGAILKTVDLDRTFERLERSGAEVVQEPAAEPDGVRRCAFFDPAGNIVRIEQPPWADRAPRA